MNARDTRTDPAGLIPGETQTRVAGASRSLVNLVGIGVCVVGLALVNQQ